MTIIQKTVQEIGGGTGPFSFDLRDALSSMRAEGFLAWEVQPFPYGPSLKEGELGPALKSQFSAAAERYKKQIRFVAEKLGNKDVRALERFATAIFVTLDLDTPPDQRAAKINELKPHVSMPEAEQAVREADEFLKEAAAAKV